jgi:hypothetical protein
MIQGLHDAAIANQVLVSQSLTHIQSAHTFLEKAIQQREAHNTLSPRTPLQHATALWMNIHECMTRPVLGPAQPLPTGSTGNNTALDALC